MFIQKMMKLHEVCKRRNGRLPILLMVALFAGHGLMAATWWVKDDGGVDASGYGTEASPFKTIQYAINTATAGDTILVKPGVYATGGRSFGSSGRYTQPARVYINKRVYIKSTDGRDVTHIVGNNGNGLNETDGSGGATMCVFADGGHCSIIEGFTLRNGGACSASGVAGGIGASGNEWKTNRFVMAYCTISNCTGAVGGMNGGFAVGCLFSRNAASSRGVAYASSLYNCIVVDTTDGGQEVFKNCGRIVNCTVVNNAYAKGPASVDAGNVSSEGGRYYNCAFFGNQVGFSDASGIYSSCVVDGTSYSSSSVNVTELSRNAPYTNLTMSAVTGDYRPVAGGRLDGQGDTTFVSLDNIPDAYRWRDFNGNAIAENSAVPIGAILPAAVPATVGVAQTDGKRFKFNNMRAATPDHVHYSETWPSQVKVSPIDSQTNSVVAISVNNYGTQSAFHNWLGRKDGIWITPPRAGALDGNGRALGPVPLYYQSVSKHLYVDCNLADYTGHNGTTWALAYATIQEAVAAASGSAAWIHVKGGTYSTGDTTDATLASKARVVVSTGNTVTFIEGVDGAENTTIVGAAGDGSYGWGTDAVRCMILRGGKLCVAGFTFSGGCAYDSGAANNRCYGGGVWCDSTAVTVADCIFTGCKALNSSASRSGTMLRCRFEGNVSAAGVSREGVSIACIYCNNFSSGNVCHSMYSSHMGVNCTIYDPLAGNGSTVQNSDTKMLNCLVAAGGNLATDNYLAGCVANPNTLAAHAEFDENEVLFDVDQHVADGRTGDFRPLAGSAAMYSGLAETTMYTPEQICRYVTCDYSNNPVAGTDGVVVGAIADSYDPITYYVDAAKADDSGDGLTPATAKKTLAGAMISLPFKWGDKVMALPGVYRNGSQLHSVKVSGSATPTIRSRVVVPSGVTLLAQGTVDETVIEGADATEPDTYGRGADAIRGAMVMAGGCLRGFTIRGGRTAAFDNAYVDDQYGGGVLGQDRFTSKVEDCIISNNVSSCGGGVNFANCNRCRFIGNVAPRYASAARDAALYNCYFKDNRGPRVTECLYDCVNCTYADNSEIDGTATVIFENMGDCANLVNVLVCGLVREDSSNAARNSMKAANVRNCVFPSGMKFYNWPTDASAVSGINTNYTRVALAEMFEDGIPVSCDTVTVDAGYAIAVAGATDVIGRSRIVNGAIDIGACEYDWLADYSAALGKRVAVTEAAPSVVETNGRVTLSDGAELSAIWSESIRPGSSVADHVKHLIPVTLTGTGSLQVYLNGALLGTLTESGTLEFQNNLPQNELVFRYSGNGLVTLARLNRLTGFVLMIL